MYLFPSYSVKILNNFAMIGFILFQFLLGVKMDPSMIWKSGKRAAVIGISALVVPLILVFCSIVILNHVFISKDRREVRMIYFVTTVLSMSTFPVIASLLTDLKMLNSDLGRIALYLSMVSDLGNTLTTLVLNNWKLQDTAKQSIEHENHDGFFGTLWKPICQGRIWLCAPIACGVYVLFVVLVVRPAMIWVIRHTPRGKPVKNSYIVLILLGVILSGLISVAIGQHVLFGPFIFGLAVPDGPPLGTTLVSKLDSFLSGLLMPLYFTISGLRTILQREHYVTEYTKVLAFMITITMLGKIVGAVVPCLFFRMPFRDALALSFILSAKGIVELSIYNIWKDCEVLNDQIFTYMIIFVGICTAIIPFFVWALYDPKKYAGYAKRTILHTKMNSELHVVACINQEENVPTIIKLLQALNPTSEIPICLYVLHLVELFGRTAPLFISHKNRKSTNSKPSQSEQIINTFQNCEQQYQGALTVQAFTSISPFKTMHEDICSIALSKFAAFIILPFHKEWAVDGTMGSVKINMRTVNCDVLDKAPCSVGILVDRGRVTATASNLLMQSSYRVAVLFFGGADDREALSFAKRMSQNTSVYITVVQLSTPDNEMLVRDQWEVMLDAEVVKDFKLNSLSNQHVVYRKEVVSDGAQTAWIIHSMENEQDLIIVGRRQGLDSPITSGLTEWSECPELGIVGDMLASSDVEASVSILMVQQMSNTIDHAE